MPKLIDADKLKEHYAWWDNEDKKIFDTIVDLQPDAVVRCKDCKWCRAGYCEKADDIIPFGFTDYEWENFYCAWGERRKNG